MIGEPWNTVVFRALNPSVLEHHQTVLETQGPVVSFLVTASVTLRAMVSGICECVNSDNTAYMIWASHRDDLKTKPAKHRFASCVYAFMMTFLANLVSLNYVQYTQILNSNVSDFSWISLFRKYKNLGQHGKVVALRCNLGTQVIKPKPTNQPTNQTNVTSM